MFSNIKRRIENILIKLIIFSPRYSSIYYAFTGKFRDEHYAIISGIYKNKNDIGNLGNLRRNIHRIEKGLITVPSKRTFAEDYICETVNDYDYLVNSSNDDSNMEIWAYSTLFQYFKVVHETLVIRVAKEKFESIHFEKNSEMVTTYPSKNRQQSSITYDSFLELCQKRRSIRYYMQQKVERKLLEKAINAALLSPSGCNRQPFQFRIIDDPQLLEKAVHLPMGAKTFANNIPMMVFIIGDLSNYFSERDRHLIYIDASLSAMSFILTLETLGLSSCVINWSDIEKNNSDLRKFLNLKDWERCIMCISVGYAHMDGGIPSSVKKELSSIVKYN